MKNLADLADLAVLADKCPIMDLDLFPHTIVVEVYLYTVQCTEQFTVYTVFGTSNKCFDPSQTLFLNKGQHFYQIISQKLINFILLLKKC